jgi:hypothetical protein
MFFGTTCTEENKETVKSILGVQNIPQEEKYLGLPTPEGRVKKDQFKSTKQRLSK